MIDARNGFNFQYLRYPDKAIDGVDTELDHIELDYLRRFLTDLVRSQPNCRYAGLSFAYSFTGIH
jgi:hypothetical protein